MRAGGQLLPGPLGERSVGVRGCLLPLPRRLQAQLRFLEPRARLLMLLPQLPFELRQRALLGARLEALLKERHDR